MVRLGAEVTVVQGSQFADTNHVHGEAHRYFWDITGLEVSAVLASILTLFLTFRITLDHYQI